MGTPRWWLGLLAALGLVLTGCFGGTGSYPVAPETRNGMIGRGLWHSGGGPSCTFSTATHTLGGVVNPRVVEPPRAGPRYVDIGVSGDIRFDTQGCQPWVQADGPFDHKYGISIYGVFAGDGDFRVGVEVPPGAYRATIPATCTWQRVRYFGHRLPDNDPIFGTNIIDSGTSGTVTIQPTDKGFVTSGCGAWVGTK